MSAICKRSHRQRGAAVTALFLCALLMSLFSGCGSLQRYSVTFADVFDTVTTFTAYSADRETFDALAERLHGQLLADHKRYDIYSEYTDLTNLCTLNRLAGSQWVQVDADLMELLLFSQEMSLHSQGKLNIALGAVLSLWREAREAAAAVPERAAAPDTALLLEAAKHCDPEDLLLDPEGLRVRFRDPELKLDVGAVAKGWAQARAGRLLDNAGCSVWLLSMGGSVSCRGTKPDGKSWIIGLEDPLDKSIPLYTFPLANSSAVTSGVDQRFFLVGSTRYHHLIDPDTAYPGELYTQVTVLLPDTAAADALSTALFFLEQEQGRALAEKFGAQALWVLPDGSRIRTEDFPESDW